MRIISGSAKGTRLLAPPGMTTRPTADRVKESLFNILGAKISGKKVLDVFAGTGALGLEALSRGAESAIFVDAKSPDIILKNAAKTHFSEKSVIIKGDVFRAISRFSSEGRKFDLVFCDPPYKKGLAERALTAIADVAEKGAVIVVEIGADEEFLNTRSDFFSLLRDKTYGKTTRILIFSTERNS